MVCFNFGTLLLGVLFTFTAYINGYIIYVYTVRSVLEVATDKIKLIIATPERDQYQAIASVGYVAFRIRSWTNWLLPS
jgi:hypothetical protein